MLTGAATLVLVAVDRVARRLLPLALLFKLSLVFPDRAPSRFRTALDLRSVGSLETSRLLPFGLAEWARLLWRLRRSFSGSWLRSTTMTR